MKMTIQLTVLEADEDNLLERKQEIMDAMQELPFPVFIEEEIHSPS
tara:strand:- start:17 stop:154 length:138 start_codon:yes stop_codon:yes gene_type:complete